MATIWQEMSCSECRVYFSFPLEDSFTGAIGVRCGVCKHPHRRYAQNGIILDDNRRQGNIVIEIDILKSQCYVTPRTNKMNRWIRDGIKGKEESLATEISDDEKIRRKMIEDLWLNKFANDTFGG